MIKESKIDSARMLVKLHDDLILERGILDAVNKDIKLMSTKDEMCCYYNSKLDYHTISERLSDETCREITKLANSDSEHYMSRIIILQIGKINKIVAKIEAFSE